MIEYLRLDGDTTTPLVIDDDMVDRAAAAIRDLEPGAHKTPWWSLKLADAALRAALGGQS